MFEFVRRVADTRRFNRVAEGGSPRQIPVCVTLPPPPLKARSDEQQERAAVSSLPLLTLSPVKPQQHGGSDATGAAADKAASDFRGCR